MLEIRFSLDQTASISGFEEIHAESEEREREARAEAEAAKREAEDTHERPLDERLLDVWLARQIVSSDDGDEKAAYSKLLDPKLKQQVIEEIDRAAARDELISFKDAIEPRVQKKVAVAGLSRRAQRVRSLGFKIAVLIGILLLGLGLFYVLDFFTTPLPRDNDLDDGR